jgi:precorrin-2 dehydrogenase/sirohydrochlorin ferrochelatase
MNAFPAFFPLAGRKVVIVGEGEGADIKARLFDGSPAQVSRLTAAQGADPAAYAGAVLAFVAVKDEAQATAAAAAARAAHVPVNVVDRPTLCDFTTPALVDRGDVVAAIGTGGTAPLLASLLRGDIEARLPEGAGHVAALLGRMQAEVREAFPDLARRRAFLRAALSGPSAEAALAGDPDRAEALLREAMASDVPAAGGIRLVDGGGPADLLTLRAARALSEADLLILDPDIAPEVLILARRDAPRVGGGDMPPAQLAERLAQGMHLVWITGPGALHARADLLAASGIDAQTLPRAAPPASD